MIFNIISVLLPVFWFGGLIAWKAIPGFMGKPVRISRTKTCEGLLAYSISALYFLFGASIVAVSVSVWAVGYFLILSAEN